MAAKGTGLGLAEPGHVPLSMAVAVPPIPLPPAHLHPLPWLTTGPPARDVPRARQSPHGCSFGCPLPYFAVLRVRLQQALHLDEGRLLVVQRLGVFARWSADSFVRAS